MAGERLTGKSGSAVPAGGDGVLRSGGDDDVCVGGAGSCCCRLFATLAVLGEGLAGENDGLGDGAIELGRFVVGGAIVYAVERGFGREAARHTRAALIATATIAASSTVVAVAVASVGAGASIVAARILRRSGGRLGVG